MALPVWGNLEKSQIDDEKIEEAIARLIQAHEDDPNAHVEVGESLQSHKVSEIIDHAVRSVVYDKIAEFGIDLKKLVGDQYMLMTCFESRDGWNAQDGDAGYIISASVFGLIVQTGGGVGAEVYMSTEPSIADPVVKFNKDGFFQTTVRCYQTTSQEIYIIVGEKTEGYGFKILNNTLYAYHNNAAGEVTTEITGITLTLHNIYRAVFDTTAGKIYFYVNGVLKATHDTDLPTGDTSIVFTYQVKTTAGGVRTIEVRDLIISYTR